MYTYIYMHTHSHPFYVHINCSAGARAPSWLPNLRSGTLDVIVCGEHLVAMDCTGGPASFHLLPFSQFISSSLNLRHILYADKGFFISLYPLISHILLQTYLYRNELLCLCITVPPYFSLCQMPF